MYIKALIDKFACVLIEGLRSIDECTEYGQYTRLIILENKDSGSDENDSDSEDKTLNSEDKESNTEDKDSDSEDDEHLQVHIHCGL